MEMEKEDLVHRLLTLEMKRFGIQYKDSPDINIDEKVREPRSFQKLHHIRMIQEVIIPEVKAEGTEEEIHPKWLGYS
ncbi:MAG: hypothetical protein IPG85_00065 [Bacteroidetes bacterium]|nr:hypothetical protein [Bacteroidota bacterium]